MSTRTRDGGRKPAAGAYDVRTFVAGLLGLYGVVLVIMGLVADNPDDKATTGSVDASLWAGIARVVVAMAFGVWTWPRPVVVERVVEEVRAGQESGCPAAH